MTFRSSRWATGTRSLKLAVATSRSGTGRSTSSRGSAGRSASGGSGTGRSTSGWSGTGRSTAGATSGTAAAVANFAATNLGHAQLGQLEAGLVAAAATRVASRSTSDRSGTARGTGSGSRTARSTGGRSRTGRSRSTARWRRSATATSVREQAGVGTVDAGETNQRGGNPNVLHLTSPKTIGPWNVSDCRDPCRTPCSVVLTRRLTHRCITNPRFRLSQSVPFRERLPI